MLEKLVQATIITFLLHLIVVLNSNTTIQSKAVPSLNTASAPTAKTLLSSVR